MKAKKIILWSFFVALVVLPLSFIGYVIINSARGFLDPTGPLRIEREYRAMENDALLNKIQGFHLQLDEHAVVILTQRKDERMIDTMLKMLTSRFERNRKIALRSLSNYEDERIIEPVMQHVEKLRQQKQKESDYEYMVALNILSKFRYEPSWPYVLEFAQADNAPANSAIRMLEYFGKPEGIPLLETMKENATSNVQKRKIEEAIQHLQEAVQK